ncbi:MAG: IclR family transcriptional regulator [Spirochaetes bacterium]|nr:IclR family transcriptional regulator [Spirochaetota bacterium]MBU0956917.1 IclR family transcriptional regulator [Spirochaetota bacterium]
MEKTVQSIDRQLDILEMVANARQGLGVSELARATELPKSTVHRILQTLCRRHYVRQDEESGRYLLSYRFLSISAQYYASLDLRVVAAPLARELSAATGAAVHLAIQRGDQAVYIEKISPYSSTCSYSEIGKTIPLYCSSIGKVLLAALEPAIFEEYLTRADFRQFTPSTLDPEALRRQVEACRKSGLAVDDGEHEADSFCVGTGIKDFRGTTIAAMSLSSSRKELSFSPATAEALVRCAGRISQIFGYEGEIANGS